MELKKELKGLFFPSLRRENNEGYVSRGSVDTVFLLLFLSMLVFGAVMSYSASSVYGEEFFGDRLYFLKRYLAFGLLSILATLPFVLFATPEFWRLFGVALYGVSLLSLIHI